MSSKKRNSRKRPKRRKPPAVVAAAAEQSDRLNRRVSRMRPRAFSGEPIEDVAVFDDSALRELPEEIADQVVAVREALSAIAEGRDQQAIGRLDGIPRRSVLSPWRLLVRGLADWYRGDFEQAAKSLGRLDRTRRPGRIAAALQLAGDGSVESAAPTAKASREADTELDSAAKLVRRIRVERPALAEARRETARRELTPNDESPDETLGPIKLSWLIGFCREHRRREPRLVEALEQAALQRAFRQPYCDIFGVAAAKLPGPPHDPKNLLLQSEYHGRFEDGDRKARYYWDRYLNQDLAGNDRISEPLRAAIASTLHLEVAREEIVPDRVGGMLSMFMMVEQEDCRAIEDNFKKSIKAYPGNAVAHRERIDWIRSHAENERSTKAEREKFAKKLTGAMVDWSKAIPDEIEPRLWLVDHFLEEEQLDRAQPHVEWLSASRHADPRVRATPWKWNLLEAMRLCRRKAWLSGVQEKLETAEGLWPSWLPRPWLAYLQAALALRSGQQDEYRRLRSLAREGLAGGGPNHDVELADAAMMLGAAQRMRVPAADLKPLRIPVDDAVKNLPGLTTNELVIAGGFFYDLHRTGLLYPAYRMHGGKFAAEYQQRLQRGVEVGKAGELGDAFWRSVFWLAERRSFSDGYQLKMPKPLDRLRREPNLAAVKLQMLLSHYNPWRLREMTAEIDLVREASQTQRDVYLRYWFTSLVDRSQKEIAKSAARNSFFGGASPFGTSFGPFDDDDDDDQWNEEDDYFDPECDCPECTAVRERLGIANPSLYEDDLEDEAEDVADDGSDSGPTAAYQDDDEMPLFHRIDVGMNAGIDGSDEDFSPLNVDLVPPRPPTPKPKMDVDPDFRRKRPKNPMKKQKKSR